MNTMSKTLFTSDNHFFHKRIMEFSPHTRLGGDMPTMNELMIQAWNSRVQHDDTVWMLGDVSFGSTEKTIQTLLRLNGFKHLVLGNHEQWLKGDAAESLFVSIQDYKKLKIDGKKVILFHYPITEWDGMHHGSYHLYGHVHGNLTLPGRAMDVGIDARPQRDMGLWEWSEIDELLSKREIRTHHGKVVD